MTKKAKRRLVCSNCFFVRVCRKGYNSKCPNCGKPHHVARFKKMAAIAKVKR